MIQTIHDKLFQLQDLGYKAFQVKLIPGIDPHHVIGVRIPQLRTLAKELAQHPQIGQYLQALPHPYYDDILLHGLIIAQERDYQRTIAHVDQLLPYIDNWATCDILSPRAFKVAKHHPQLLLDIRRWMASPAPYTIRFGIEMLMSHFLDTDFQPEQLSWVTAIRHEHYYVRMMQAWYLATALAKQWQATLPYLQQPTLDPWTHNKAIQKAIESYRITPEQKDYLRLLKVSPKSTKSSIIN